MGIEAQMTCHDGCLVSRIEIEINGGDEIATVEHGDQGAAR